MPHDRTSSIRRNIGLRFTELRLAKGWTQEECGEQLGLSLKYVQKLESGKRNLRVDTLVNLAKLYSVPVADLFEAPSIKTAKVGRPRKRS